MERVTGRWIHPASGRSYHEKFAPPKASRQHARARARRAVPAWAHLYIRPCACAGGGGRRRDRGASHLAQGRQRGDAQGPAGEELRRGGVSRAGREWRGERLRFPPPRAVAGRFPRSDAARHRVLQAEGHGVRPGRGQARCRRDVSGPQGPELRARALRGEIR